MLKTRFSPATVIKNLLCALFLLAPAVFSNGLELLRQQDELKRSRDFSYLLSQLRQLSSSHFNRLRQQDIWSPIRRDVFLITPHRTEGPEKRFSELVYTMNEQLNLANVPCEANIHQVEEVARRGMYHSEIVAIFYSYSFAKSMAEGRDTNLLQTIFYFSNSRYRHDLDFYISLSGNRQGYIPKHDAFLQRFKVFLNNAKEIEADREDSYYKMFRRFVEMSFRLDEEHVYHASLWENFERDVKRAFQEFESSR